MKLQKKKITTLPLFCRTRAIMGCLVVLSTIASEDLLASSELAQARMESSSASSSKTPLSPAQPSLSPPPPPPPPSGGLPLLTPGPSTSPPRPLGHSTHTIPVNYFFEVPTPTYDGNRWHNNGTRDLPPAQEGYVWFIFYSNGHYYAVQVPYNATITVGPDGRFIISWTDQNGEHSYTLSPTNPMVVGQEDSTNTMQLYNFPPGTTMQIYRVHGTGVLSVEPGPGNPTGLSRLLSPPYGGTNSGPGDQHIRQTGCPQVPCPPQPLPRPTPPAPPPPSGGTSGGSTWGGTSGGGGGGPGGGSGGGTTGGTSDSSGTTGSSSSGTSGGGTDGGSGSGCQTGDDNSDCGEDEGCDESIA